MQVLDDEKRKRILKTAAKMFARKHYHEVRLEDIATKAGVGKGTVYTYFKSKDELHFAILFQGFAELVDKVAHEPDDDGKSAAESLESILRAIAHYAYDHPHVFELMRTSLSQGSRPKWIRKREELMHAVERVVRRGVKNGEWRDPHPEWTGNYITALVRSVMLFGTPPKNPETLVRHMHAFVINGLAGGKR